MGLDYYAILSVPRNSTKTEIKLAYRKWAIATHPQRKPYPNHPMNPPEGLPHQSPFPFITTEKHWELVNEAYDVLSNDLYRIVYDVYGEEGLKGGVPTNNGYIDPYAYHGDYMKTYVNAMSTASPYADLIDAITNPPPLYSTKYGMGVKVKDKDIEKLLYLDLDEIFYGGIKKMKIIRYEFVDEANTKRQKREKILLIPFTPGIASGLRIKFKEEGDQCVSKIPADIIFIVSEKPHDRFERNGANLKMTLHIDLQQALCGFTPTILTIDGKKMDIPITDTVTNDYIKIIPEEGLPFPDNSSKRGDLIIKFEVSFPTFITRDIKLKLSEIFDEINKIKIF